MFKGFDRSSQYYSMEAYFFLQENRYDLSAGCLPCPPCYNLVQKHVHELQKKLVDVFGGVPDPDGNNGTSQLYEQITKLNETVQNAYNAALRNSLGELPKLVQR